MLDAIVKVIEQPIMDLPFVQCYGGLVRTVSQQICVDASLGIFKTRKFPVTCKADQSCINMGMQQAIVPDSSKRSIFYFEGNNITPKGAIGAKSNIFQFRSKLRLVGWLNLSSFGFEECEDVSALAACVLASGIIGDHKLIDPFNSGTVTVGLPTIICNNPTIFSKYDYNSNIIQNMIYPYGYFAMDFPIDISFGKNCIDCNDVIGDPIECQVV